LQDGVSLKAKENVSFTIRKGIVEVVIHQLLLEFDPDEEDVDIWDQSGSHDNFGNFVGNKSYLEEYWKLLHDTDDAILNSYVISELPEDVFNSSLIKCEKRPNKIISTKIQTKKAKMALDERRVQAIEVLAQSMNSFYSKDAKEKESFVSVCEEKMVYFQNKLIEAYEKKEKLTNRMAKDILDDQ